MENFRILPIGIVKKDDNQFHLDISKPFASGLENLQGFSHLFVLWWAHLNEPFRKARHLSVTKLFKRGPERMGVFSTRHPQRPNPIMISTIKVLSIDMENGIISTPFIDAEPGSPILDLKPYYPMDRVQTCETPDWCRHWPQWQEETISFNWKNEIVFDQSET